MLQAKGPLLLAANHPNSFLDGIILTTLFDQPVYSLARGDAFKNKWVNKILRSLQLLPVYRTSEGVENLEQNYTTFASCIEVFKKGGIVLIFSEGRCENEWHLRPLKKGTARLAITAWESGLPLQVLPVGFNYSSFKSFGKSMHLLFGTPFTQHIVKGWYTHGKQLLAFNTELQQQLQPLVYEIAGSDKASLKEHFYTSFSSPSLSLLAIPAFIGWLIHLPLYAFAKGCTYAFFKNSGHYDSVITALLFILYPFYLLAMAATVYGLFAPEYMLTVVAAPLLAMACTRWKYYLEEKNWK